jgi:excisionase family DNA binding protein
MMTTERLAYSPTEAASLLGIHKSKMYQMIAAGEIPALHVGSRLKISARRLEEWIEEQERKENER